MKKYLFILVVIASCNSNMETAGPMMMVRDSTAVDSLSAGMDSIIDQLSDIKIDAASYIRKVESKIAKLESDKKNLEERGTDASVVYVEKKNDDKRIAELTKQISIYQNEIASLKSQLRVKKDEEYIAKKDQLTDQVVEPEKPDESSLIVELNKRIRGNGNISTDNVNVYLIPYSKKARKEIVRYEESCDLSEINYFGGVAASYFNDQYFFNNVKPGKYIIKVCYYYGGFAIVEKDQDRMIVKMNVTNTQ